MTRDQIVAEARSWIGTPYAHQASVKGAGVDCLGLARGVWRALVGPEPEPPPTYSPDWAEALGRETLYEAFSRHMVEIDIYSRAPGDVLLFNVMRSGPAKHCGIMTTPTRMVHAVKDHPAAEVHVATFIGEKPTRRALRFAFSFPGITRVE